MTASPQPWKMLDVLCIGPRFLALSRLKLHAFQKRVKQVCHPGTLHRWTQPNFICSCSSKHQLMQSIELGSLLHSCCPNNCGAAEATEPLKRSWLDSNCAQPVNSGFSVAESEGTAEPPELQ